ncbi:MAG: NADH-quinone oxidoreductase subunit NuoK [Candidatus Dormibacteria bacterium]
MSVGPEHYAVLSALVFALGIYGVLARSTMPGVLISLMLLVTAPVIALVGFSHVGGGGATPPSGEALALFGVIAAGAQLATGIGIALLVWRRIGSADIDDLAEVDG